MNVLNKTFTSLIFTSQISLFQDKGLVKLIMLLKLFSLVKFILEIEKGKGALIFYLTCVAYL